MELPKIYGTNKTVHLFRKICKFIYLSCATNFGFEETDLPNYFIRIYTPISKVLEVIVIIFIASEWGSFYTQKNLTEKQLSDLYLFAFSHVVLYMIYASAMHHRDRIRELIVTLTVTLKKVCNDDATEKAMIKKTYRSLTATVFFCSGSLFSYGIDAGVKALTSNATFTTIIPIWPDVEDRQFIAGFARIIHYIIWWIFAIRVISIYLIILCVTICLGHQFTNLYKYFIKLNDIFEEEGSQEDKERSYENAVKVGVKMHSITLWCAKQTQVTCGVAYSGQVIITVSVLVLLMIQMMHTERTLTNVASIAMLGSSVLVGSAVFMLNAGDITTEASRLPTAMFQSGWHNCRGQSSVRARKLLTLAMTEAQNPVVIKGLGVIQLSYESYVSMVKSSYSVFSVIY
uniref:Odorant receptor n=1 Tax=Ctenopseustis obliquana TaxID=65030 RepID=A0A097IYK2_9NEOP|nr:olfactory receptor 58 [Ctenopseustis obliquana]